MGETFKYCAPIAGSLGFSVEDTAEAIGLMANAGIKSTQAGTSLRTVMTSLSGDVKICGSAIGEVTVATANADGSMRDLSDILADCRAAFAGLTESEKASAAESLVGKNAMSGFLALMDAGEGDINKLSGAINDCDGAAQKMADTMNDNLEGQFTILKSALEELAISFGQLLIPALRDVVQWLQGFVGFLNSLPEGVKKTIVVIALVAAALGPVLIIVGKVISSIGTTMTIIPKLAGVIGTVQKAFAALHVTMLANPIALIIAAITALVAAFIYLWNTNEEFRKFWISLWEDVKRVAVEVWEGISQFMSQAWEAIRQTAVTVWNGMKQTITTVITGIRDTVSRVWNSIKSTVTSVVNALKSAVGGAFTSMWNGIRSTVSGIYDTIKSGFAQAVGYVTGLASRAFQWGSDLINGIVNGIRSAIGNVVGAVRDVANTIRSHLHFSVPDEGPLTDYESWMPDFMKGLAQGIEKSKGMVKKAMNGVAQDMVISPTVGASGVALAGEGSVNSADLSSLAGMIREGFSGVSGNGGDIVIPVYLGGTMLDEVIVNAQQRANLRSGGR